MNAAVTHTVQREPAGFALQRTFIWRIKLKLQFTGWLQYMPSGVAALVFLLLAGVGWLIGLWPALLFWTPLSIGLLLSANTAFEIVTLKLGLRPPEPLPAPLDGLDAFDVMRARRACRSFQKRNLTPAHREALLGSVALNSQPERQIGKSPIRFEYVAAPLTVWPVVGAHEFLVAIAPKTYDRLAVINVGRSLQKVVIDATRMGLATCWIGPGADQKSIVAKLGDRFDPEKDHVICVCAVGYESALKPLTIRFIQRSQHWRRPLEQLFFSDPELQQPLDVKKPPFDAFGRCYEVCQWSPSSYNGQTTRAAAALEERDGRATLARMDFYASTSSRYYAAVALGIWCANWELGAEALGTPGHFSVLSSVERGLANDPGLPHYDVSWIADHHLT
jgi:nitroreductase